MSELIKDLTGNSKFENLKLFTTLITNFCKIKTNSILLIDMNKKEISNSISIGDDVNNTINFAYNIGQWEYGVGFTSEKPVLFEINNYCNISKRCSKMFFKLTDDIEFLNKILISLEKELLKC